jgi:predicted hotdog family 3-hydroxylacyl-ACP dehydratase
VSGGFPPVEELLPQTGPMRLVDRVLAHDAVSTVCRVDPDRSRLFRDADGRIPVWVALEYMAQCIAVHGGLLARAQGAAPEPGLFLGSRRVLFHRDAFEPDQPLTVSVRHAAGRTRTLAFDCAVRGPAGDRPLAEGRLHVFQGPDLAALADRAS